MLLRGVVITSSFRAKKILWIALRKPSELHILNLSSMTITMIYDVSIGELRE